MKKQITSYGSFVVMRAAIKTSINVLIKIRQNADTETGNKFTSMITELQEMQAQLHSGEYRYFETTGDGLQVALLAYDVYMNELEKATGDENASFDFDNWKTIKTEHKHIDKRVKIQDANSAALKVKLLSPSQIVYRECRRFIESHTAPDTRRQKVCYYADVAKVVDENGLTYKEMIYTEKAYGDTTKQTEIDIDYIVDAMQLTKTQRDVLKLRLKGYGIKAIGTYYGKSFQAVAKTLKQIQVKFTAIFDLTKEQIEYAESELIALLVNTFTETETDTNETETETDTNETETKHDTMTAYERYTANMVERERKAANIAMMIESKNKVAREKVAANIACGLVFPD